MLILSGGGAPENVVSIDRLFSEQIDRNKTILYFHAAMEESCFTYEECFKWFKDVYGQYGITNIEMSIDLKKTMK